MSLRKVGNYYWLDIRIKGKRIQKLTGIPFHFPILKHYFALSLVEKGVDFLTVSEILGHSKITVSLGYTHTDKERKRRAVVFYFEFYSYRSESIGLAKAALID